MNKDKKIMLIVNDKEKFYFYTMEAAQQVADMLKKCENAKCKIEEI